MKNKELLLLAGMLLLVASCKRDIQNPVVVDSDNQVIALSSGTVMGRAANIGMRSEFETGDQIGVTAIFDSVSTPGTPNWIAPAHFENCPAAHLSNNTDSPVVTTFGWGPAAQGGVAYNKYYPSRSRKIFLYSYYPYVPNPAVDAPTSYVPINLDGTTDEERQPKLNVTLVSGAINGTASDVLKKQPDILYYIGATPVSSVAQTPKFVYNHALAQIRFTIKRPNGSTPCVFKKLVFKTAAKATLNLATGLFAYPTADATNRRDAVYTIELASGVDNKIPEIGSVADAPEYLDIFNPEKLTSFNYLMVLPLSDVDARLSEITLTCDYGKSPEVDEKDFNIPLDGLSEWQPGKMNTMAISVAQYSVAITASITPWGAGTETELPAE